MADIVDKANDWNELRLDLLLKHRKRDTLPAIGTCHYCEAAVKGGKLFCNSDCAEDHQRLVARRAA